MTEQKRVHVFVGSPDMDAVLRKLLADKIWQWDKLNPKSEYMFIPRTWSDDCYPQTPPTPCDGQFCINTQLIDKCDLLFALIIDGTGTPYVKDGQEFPCATLYEAYYHSRINKKNSYIFLNADDTRKPHLNWINENEMGLFWGGDKDKFEKNVFEKIFQVFSVYIESNAKPTATNGIRLVDRAEPLSKYEIDILRYALANPGDCFITGWVDGKFQIGSHVKNRDDVLNRNGNDDTNAEYAAAVKNLVEKRQYAEQLDRPSRRYKYYKLLASGRKIIKELSSLADSLSSEARKLLVEISKVSPTFGYSVSFVKYDGGREVVVPPSARGYTDEENRERERALLSLLDASSLGAQLLASVGVDKWSLLPLGRVLAYIIENEPNV